MENIIGLTPTSQCTQGSIPWIIDPNVKEKKNFLKKSSKNFFMTLGETKEVA